MASKSSVSFLPKVMLIKDQINVAYLLTSAKKIMKDRLRYNIHSDNDDKIKYRHYNRLEFRIFGSDIKFNIRTFNWQLKIIKKM